MKATPGFLVPAREDEGGSPVDWAYALLVALLIASGGTWIGLSLSSPSVTGLAWAVDVLFAALQLGLVMLLFVLVGMGRLTLGAGPRDSSCAPPSRGSPGSHKEAAP